MDRLIIVSNRLPISVSKSRKKIEFIPSVGGLATGLDSFYRSYESLWIGWPGITREEISEEEEENIRERLMEKNCYPVFLTQKDMEYYYYGFCNKTIWPLFHYFYTFTIYNEKFWKAYKNINQAFCETTLKIARPGDIIWIHDYHLMLLPKLIRDTITEATIGFFLHIPFPSFELFRLLPWRREILRHMLACDLIGFHTYEYVHHFLNSVRRILGYEHTFGQITVGSHLAAADVFPMGIDFNRYSTAVNNEEVQKEIERIRGEVGAKKIILSIDRLDYTKGLIHRLEAFDAFLERYPSYREKVTLVIVTAPSRTGVRDYHILKTQLDELVGRINGKYGVIGWVPVWYLYRAIPFKTLIALYNLADIALVTPLRDGMNLISKEYIAAKSDGKGVLILSEMAGAARELGEAIIVNPNNKTAIVEAIREAIEMPEEEQISSASAMRERIRRYDVIKWATEFVGKLLDTKNIQKNLYVKRLGPKVKEKLITDLKKNKKRLILLDYDGTLVPFHPNPAKAEPDEVLLKLLKDLSMISEVVIISGRDRDTLDRWLEDIDLNLVAEHGAAIKEKRKNWEMTFPMDTDWKEKIRPVMEVYMDRTPGSFIEEKEFSLVWHYRKSDPELSDVRARELKDALLNLVTNLDLAVIEGSKVIEVKNVTINKGKATLHWLNKEAWDFILAVGDDVTDEDMFSVLPKKAYSIKVGLDPSRALYSVGTVSSVRKLLKELTTLKNLS